MAWDFDYCYSKKFQFMITIGDKTNKKSNPAFPI